MFFTCVKEYMLWNSSPGGASVLLALCIHDYSLYLIYPTFPTLLTHRAYCLLNQDRFSVLTEDLSLLPM